MPALARNFGVVRRVLAGLAAILPLSISNALAGGMRTFRFPRSHRFLQSSDSTTATGHEVNDKNDNSDHQQEVNEAACDVKTDA
jgi:hypothetical protein